jgi:signal transduction histidine kinase
MFERLPYMRDELDAPLDAGQTIMISNVYTDTRVSEELRRIQRQDSRPALAMIPLLVRGRRIGLVILTYPAIHDWQPEHLHSYQITAAQLATAVDSRLQQALLAKHDQQLAVLEERHRLARELHDSVTQLLFSITLIAQSLGPAWRRNPAEGEQRIQRLLELSQAALAEMRALLVELRPPEHLSFSFSDEEPGGAYPLSSLGQVQQYGLAAALRAHIINLARDGLLIDLDTSAYASQTSEHEETLFRLAQESLNNVLKHANAAHVQVQVVVQDGAVYLSIRDDGVGFRETPRRVDEATDAARGDGMGLRTMRERAAALGGTLRIKTAPGKGTAVEVVIPARTRS